MKLEVKCEVCGNEGLTYRKGKYGGFYCNVCDDICDVEIIEDITVNINAMKREIKLNVPFDIQKKMNEEEQDEVNEKIFDIARYFNNIVQR